MGISQISIELLAPGCDRKTVLCSGSFNEWNTNLRVVALSKAGPGLYRGTANWEQSPVEYKYHLGDWDSEELDNWGRTRGNRVHLRGNEIRDVVPQFLEAGNYYNPAFLPRIEELPPNLPMPPGFATRRIAALVPYDYERSQKRYPVIYLQDGQNLFDEYAPYGNWELDKRLAWLAERGLGDIIIVAIDHAKEKRIVEYTPPHDTRLGHGIADEYGSFLVNHLKVLIDKNYRTISSRDGTFIGGSSMGALASLHVAMTYPHVFAKAMLLSPAIWVDPDMADRWVPNREGATKIFLFGGMREGKGSTATFAKLDAQLRALSKASTKVVLRSIFSPDGEHNEYTWGRVFPEAISYLIK